MPDRAPSRRKVDELLTTDPLTVFAWRVQPVARLAGRETNGTEQTGPFFSSTGKITPFEIRVDGAGGPQVIRIDDPAHEPFRAMLFVSAALSALSILAGLLIPFVIRWKK